ncbi:hypothetical protein TURU_111419 [Turdus rufiventris]|nr:hypothetical protein TURU_111419 [Turdus rufiventris]
MVSKTHSPFNSLIWPVCKSNGEWRLTVDYCGLNEITPSLSAAMPDMLEFQYELESKAAKWCHHQDCYCVFLHSFSIRLQATFCFHLEERAVHLEPTVPGVEAQSYHLLWTDPDCTGKGDLDRTHRGFGHLAKASELPAQIPGKPVEYPGFPQDSNQGYQQDRCYVSLTIKKETQALLGTMGFWRMHIPKYRQIVSPLYLVTRKKNDFKWGSEKQ